MSAAADSPRNLSQQRKLAKELLAAARAGDSSARDRMQKAGAPPSNWQLADAQRAVARESGFDSWPAMVKALERAELIAAAQAIHSGDAKRVRAILKSSPSARRQVNSPIGAYGMRPIHLAAKHRDVLDVLIDFGADINARSDWRKGPFGVLDECDEATARHLISRGAKLTAHAAARLGWIDELRSILHANPQAVHELGGDGQRPLHFAKTVEIAELLLDRGAEIDARDTDHESTAAQYALVDRPDVARHLLSRGARPDIFMPTRLGDLALAQKLIDEYPASVTARTWQTNYPLVPKMSIYNWTLGFLASPFEVALKYGHGDVFELLKRNSPPIVRFIDGALRDDRAATAEALRDDPDVIKSLTADHHSLLPLAVFHGRFDAARLMLQLGFDPLALGEDGGSTLHAACWLGNVALVSDLIARGVPLNDPDPTHLSPPLGWAAYGSTQRREPTGDYLEVIRLLVAAGADVHASGNKHGKSLIEMGTGNPRVQDVLRELGAS